MAKTYQGEDFNKLIENKVLIDFYADWCGPCQALNPILKKINDIDIIKVNVDKYQKLARENSVMSIPCLILFNNSKEIKRNIGPITEDNLKEFIKE